MYVPECIYVDYVRAGALTEVTRGPGRGALSCRVCSGKQTRALGVSISALTSRPDSSPIPSFQVLFSTERDRALCLWLMKPHPMCFSGI